MRMGRILEAIGVVAVFWGMALLVALNDIDFFSFQDLFDTTEWHHEHIVAALLFVGLIMGGTWLLLERYYEHRA